MRELPRGPFLPVVTGAMLLTVALGACRPKAPESPPAPTPPAPETVAPAEAAVTAPEAAQSPQTPVAPGGAAPASATPAPESVKGPALAAMALASTSTKLGAPVDLRYSFDGPVEAGRPVTLHLAAVPRAGGSNLTVSIKEEAGIQAAAAPITVQKASAGTAYRQQLSVTRAADGPAEVRVLVTMDMPIGQSHSWFSVPFAGTAAAGKKTTVEMH